LYSYVKDDGGWKKAAVYMVARFSFIVKGAFSGLLAGPGVALHGALHLGVYAVGPTESG
jgi:hypothetical protein